MIAEQTYSTTGRDEQYLPPHIDCRHYFLVNLAQLFRSARLPIDTPQVFHKHD